MYTNRSVMICMRTSRTLLKSISISLLFLSCYLLLPCVCFAQEKTYTITQSQLTILETNLTKLKQQNKILQEQLKNSKTQVQTLQTQSKMLQTQVQSLTQSLTNAQALLNKYETQQDKDYSIGLGISNNSLALNADIKKVWCYVDNDTVAIGYKIDF